VTIKIPPIRYRSLGTSNRRRVFLGRNCCGVGRYRVARNGSSEWCEVVADTLNSLADEAGGTVEQIRVGVCAQDPMTRAGLVNCLEAQSGVIVVEDVRRNHADVVVAAFDRLNPEAVAALHAVTEVATPVVLVQDRVNSVELLASIERRVVALLPRGAAADGRLTKSVRAAAGDDCPSNTLRELQPQPHPQPEVNAADEVKATSLSPREIAVLRLAADGLDSGEIAQELCYSERTVKNVIYLLTKRLHLQNRSHAVAFALRAGVI
jgi:DNA-binding NarL/FixJ family response regulator